jgi:hypothetical protein
MLDDHAWLAPFVPSVFGPIVAALAARGPHP